MRKLSSIIAVLFCAILMTNCTSAAPDADEEGVLIKKPWFFEHGGVDESPVQTGQTWCAPSTDVVYVKTTPIAYDEHIEDAYSNDNRHSTGKSRSFFKSRKANHRYFFRT